MSEVSEIQNKEMLLYSAEQSVNEVRKLKYEDVPDEEAYYRIGTAIQWLVDCFDRIKESGREIKQHDERWISGLKFVNNGFKHKPSFKKADVDERFSFQISYQMMYGSKYDFANLDDVDHSQTPGEYEEYKNVLQGRDIISFLSATLDAVKNYYKDL